MVAPAQEGEVGLRVSVRFPEVLSVSLDVVAELGVAPEPLLAHLAHILDIVTGEHVHVLGRDVLLEVEIAFRVVTATIRAYEAGGLAVSLQEMCN